MHLSNSLECRNFTDQQYFIGADGQMPGSINFMAEAVIRVLQRVSTADGSIPELIFGNANLVGGGQGWAIYSTPQGTLSANGEQLFSITFFLVGSTNLLVTATFPLTNVMGKTLHVAVVVQTIPVGEGDPVTFCSLYVNGGLVGTDSKEGFTATVSATKPGVGYIPEFLYGPLQCASVLSVGYTELENPSQVPDRMSIALSSRFLDTMKRASVLTTLNEDISENLEMDYVYNVATSNGSIGTGQPSVLVNTGSAAPAGNLTKGGSGTSLITTAAYTEWGSPVIAVVAQG